MIDNDPSYDFLKHLVEDVPEMPMDQQKAAEALGLFTTPHTPETKLEEVTGASAANPQEAKASVEEDLELTAVRKRGT